jgi:uncharacterized protein
MSRTDVRLAACLAAVLLSCALVLGDEALPRLTDTVNDFAGVVDQAHRSGMDRMIRALHSRTGDAVVVATIKTFAPYPDIREYAVKLFENGGRGIGEKGKDNGLLVLLAVDDRRVWVEVGYDLEGIVTDGFAGETSRQVMAPRFRQGDYGAGLEEGVRRIIGRIAQARNVTLDGVPEPAPASGGQEISLSPGTIFALFVILIVIIRLLGAISRFNRPRGWGRRRTWSGWHSGVGPFGGGFGGGWGSGGGGFGGGFGGFGGGRSGGGGGGASW